jgi:AcrR family transcriptional regulator
MAVAQDAPPARRIYRGASSEERQAERRRRLLESALELYGTLGFANVSIQTLCSHSGVTARHLYEEFASRDQVLEAVHDQIVAEVAELVVDALAQVPADDPDAMSTAGLRAFYSSMLEDARRARITMIEVMGLPAEKAVACVDRFGAIIESYAAELDRLGLIQLESVHLTAVILAGAVRQLVIDWLMADGDETTIEQLVEVSADLFSKLGGYPRS